MNYRVLLFGGAAALVAGSAIAQQQQPDWNAIQVTAQPIRPGLAVLFGNGGNIAVSYGEDGTLIVDDQFAPLRTEDPGGDRRSRRQAGQVPRQHPLALRPRGRQRAVRQGRRADRRADGVRDRLAAGGAVVGNASARRAAKAALPVVTYDRGVTFHLNGDTIDVVHTGGGPTDGDSVVYGRKANALRTGDMMMNGAASPFVDLGLGRQRRAPARPRSTR